MTAVSLLGIILSVAAIPFGLRASASSRLLLLISLLVVHVAASTAYYFYAQSNPADASLYFYDTAGMARFGFGFGTIFTVHMVDFLRGLLGGTFFDYFLLFQSFGFWGIVLLARCLEETQKNFRVPPTRLSYLVLFLPGMHFWTSAIGKDAPLFLAVSLAVWSAMWLSRRWVFFALAIVIMLLFRPHVALITTMSVAIAAILDVRSSAGTKIALVGVAVVGAVIIAGTVQNTLTVDVTSAQSISEFFERQQDISHTIGGSTNVADASFAFRMFSLLFRPLFLDASGIFALVSSFENLLFIFVIGFLLINWRETFRLFRSVFFLRFALVYTVFMAILLTLVYYNVGLGVRQKMMMVPALFTFFITQWAVQGSRFAVGRNAMARRSAPGRPAPVRAETGG